LAIKSGGKIPDVLKKVRGNEKLYTRRPIILYNQVGGSRVAEPVRPNPITGCTTILKNSIEGQ